MILDQFLLLVMYRILFLSTMVTSMSPIHYEELRIDSEGLTHVAKNEYLIEKNGNGKIICQDHASFGPIPVAWYLEHPGGSRTMLDTPSEILYPLAVENCSKFRPPKLCHLISSFTISTSSYYFANFQKDQAGTYVCTWKTGNERTEKKIIIKLEEVVKLSKPTTAYTATFKEEKVLTCSATSGYPPPIFTWEYQINACDQSTAACKPAYDNWKVVKKESHDDMKSWITAGPTIDNHFYRCIGKNRISKDVYNFKLFRTKKEVLFDFTAFANPINENSSLQLNCSIDSSKFKSADISKFQNGAWVLLNTKESETADDNVKVITYTKLVSELDDSTQYRCKGINSLEGEIKKKTLGIVVKALVLPTIQDFRNRTVNQDQNGNLKIICNVSGNPLPSVMWKHNGLPLDDNRKSEHIDQCKYMHRGIYFKTDSDNTLIICHLDFKVHAGSFECSATNKVGLVTKEMTLNIEGSPRINNWKEEVTTSVDDSAELICIVSANPRASVTWQKIDEKGALVKPHGNMPTVGVLRFNQVVEEDAGKYRCIAENKFKSSSKDLTFIVNPAPPKKEVLFDFSAFANPINENSSLQLNCSIDSSKFKSADISKFQNGAWVLLNTKESEEVVDNVKVITYTKPVSELDDGTQYRCMATNIRGIVKNRTLGIVVKALVLPTIQDFRNRTVNQDQNGNLKIICNVSGNPLPSVMWKHNGLPLDDNRKSEHIDQCKYMHRGIYFKKDSDNTLIICHLDYKVHAGSFECSATNKVGSVTKEMMLNIEGSPRINNWKEEVTTSVDDSAELICIVSANPRANVTWQKIDEKGALVKPHGNMSTVGVLRFNQVFEEDAGKYRCIAENKFKSSSKDLNFRVKPAPPKKEVLFDFSAFANPINENSSLQLNCSIDSSKFKSADISKFQNGAWVLLNTKESEEVVDNVKVITYTKLVSELDDGTQYRCMATNIRGIVKNRTLGIVVKALVLPTIQDFRNRTVNQDQNGNLKIICNVSGNPLPSVMWKHNGLPLDDNQEIKHIDRCMSMRRGIYFKTDTDNKTLIICHLDFEVHAGSFKCLATNDMGSFAKKMTLNIEVSPRFNNWKEEVTTSVDDDIELRCDVSANPRANVTWQKIDEKGALVKPRGNMSTVGVLRFNQVSEEDAGKYRCIAENKFKRSSKDLNFRVKSAPPVTALNYMENSNGTIIGVVIGFVILFIIGIVPVFIYQRRLKKKYPMYLEPKENFQLDKDRTLFEQSSELPYDMAWEYPRERLAFIKTLGSGAFGQVWLAEAEGIRGFKPRDSSIDACKRRKSLQKSRRYRSILVRYKKTSQFTEVVSLEKSIVAVKTLKDDADKGEYKELASELKILIHLGEHKNIVNLLGACTTGGKLCVILECCPHGSLLSFLGASRDSFQPVWKKHQTDMQNEITYIDLLIIAYQVGKGMDFLQSKKCVHRDLAARNVLIGDDYVVKIADFGLARDIYNDEFYLKQTTGLLPVKWLSPESLIDKVFSASSDVWSFGILLWEIFTLGGSPYPGLPNTNLFSYLEEGKRMDCPNKCPKDVYEIMLDCWDKSPCNRPLFSQLVERLNNVMKHNVSEGDTNGYLDFVDNGGNQNNYLEAQSNDLKRAASSEYLEATTRDATHPKGNAHVPLLTETINNANGDLSEDRCVSTDDHHKLPISVGQPPFQTV